MAVRWTTLFTLVTGTISLVIWGRELAIGIACGALLGLANLTLLGRALMQLVANSERHRPAPGSKWILPGVLLVKWPLLLLALAGILWYLPARPEGVAFGVLLSLLGAALAARRSQASGSETDP